jgi:uncharacterized protein
VIPSLRPLRLNTVELLREPGSERRVAIAIPATDLDVPTEHLDRDTVEVDLVARSTIDGITVTGRVAVAWRDECRRCLRPVTASTTVEVDEVYQRDATDPDVPTLGADALDLVPVVRDAALLALDHVPPLCRDDCPGWCPTCGADLAEGPCGCDAAPRDERWAALDALRVQEPHVHEPRVED